MRPTFWAIGLAAAVMALTAAAEGPLQYSTSRDLSPAHLVMADLLSAEWPDLEVSSPLSVAAEQLARADHRGLSPSSSVIRKALHAAGLPESTAVAATVSTTEDGAGDVLDYLAEVMKNGGPVTHVGLGRAPAESPPFRWHWVILLIERRVELFDPVPAAQEPATAFPIEFALKSGWNRPRILVQYPNGRTRRMTPASRSGGWFTVVPVGRTSGTLVLQILAENDVGPGVCAVMPIRIGGTVDEAPERLETSEPPSPSGITDPLEAALFLWEIVNNERIEYGLEALEWDPALAEIAASHSQDMEQNDFFGHRSPIHGDLRQRMTSASYIAAVSRENLALDHTLRGAHLALMASPGHRSNILAPGVTVGGIGVVRQSSKGTLTWIITEIFARPFPEALEPETP